MDPATAISLLDQPLGTLPAPEDRFIAAERLKFFPGVSTVAALLRYIRKAKDATVLEDRVARRKCVESLGRFGGDVVSEEVVETLTALLDEPDAYLVEVAVWALSEVTDGREDVMASIMETLGNDGVEKRGVIRALLKGRYKPAVNVIKRFVDDGNAATASAAMAAVAVLSGERDVMKGVVKVLTSSDLNVRRCAIDDIALARYTPALGDVITAPNSLVLRARAARILVNDTGEVGEEVMGLFDRLIWDHPGDLDLLGMVKETRKARDPERNIRQLYKNDAVYAYLASRTLAEDHSGNDEIGGMVEKSYKDLDYFDYFGAYHVYKTLGWMRYGNGYDLLIENAEKLPPRFFNHQAGAITALAMIGRDDAVPVIRKVASETDIWELKYACLIASQRLGDYSVRERLKEDDDWLIRARANADAGFNHLRESFS